MIRPEALSAGSVTLEREIPPYAVTPHMGSGATVRTPADVGPGRQRSPAALVAV